MIWVVYPGSVSQIQIKIFYPSWILDPGVKKAPDPGTGTATLVFLTNKMLPSSEKYGSGIQDP
jgi:hypothetical protein